MNILKDLDLIIPSEWNKVRLATIANVIDPEPSHRAPALADGEGFPYIGIRDVNNDGTVNTVTARPIKEESLIEQEKRFTINNGDLIFCRVATLGNPKIIKLDTRVALSATLALIKPKRDLVNNMFLLYLLDSDYIKQQTKLYATGSTRKSLGMETIRKFEVLLPPIHVQNIIAAYLFKKISLIENIIKVKERYISLLEQQRQSIITEAVTKGLNPNVKMKDSCVEWIGEIPEHWDMNKIKFKFDIRKVIQPTDNPTVLSLTQRGLKIKNLKDFSGQHAESYDKYQKVELRDYVMNGMDLLTGYVDCSPFEGVTSPDYRVFRIKDDTECHDYYLRYFQICYFAKIFYGHGQGVSNFGRWRLQTDVFKEFPLPVPPQEEQFEISEYLKNKEAEIDKSLDLLKVSIEKLKEYRQSLIYEAVTGKIDVREMELH